MAHASSSPDPRADRFVDVDGMSIRYRRSGTGPPLLLLHGTTSSLDHFDGLVDRLGHDHDLTRLDLPGFGVTGPHPRRDYRIGSYVEVVSRFLDEVGIERCAVLGNSLGGNIAWNLALDLPEQISALVVVNATGYPEKELPTGMALARKPWVRPVLRRVMPRGAVEKNLRAAVGVGCTIVDDAMVDRVHRHWSRPGNRGAFVDLVNTDQIDRTGDLTRIAVPTLVLGSASIPSRFARDIPGAVEVIHPDAGHLLPEEQPDWVAHHVAAFLAERGITG
ncbi:alpha/beta fold hydrolase [Williamsia sp. MIQD14]|uniref:alpha/beta fold hydrolase n=1 Tax=Williamsia sp. MIQD14 TaxID=3425703 RepID=UPI003DA0DDA7